jgi:PD-(D/E)XK nuclease superfamily
LPTLDLLRTSRTPGAADDELRNAQTAELFATERRIIEAAAVPLTWIRPSDHDPDRITMIEAIPFEPIDPPEIDAPVGAGRIRGLLLHKLMEEVLTGELVEDVGRFAARARELLTELATEPAGSSVLPDAGEIAATVWRTLQLPDIAALRGRLIPEWPVYTLFRDRPAPEALVGRIDAIAYEGDRADVIVDWKSNIDPSDNDMSAHEGQLHDYLRVTNAPRGALVYMTPGVIRWLTFPESRDYGPPK